MANFRHTYRIVDVYFVFYIIILHFKNFVPFYFIIYFSKLYRFSFHCLLRH
jgi:hypothetical protein